MNPALTPVKCATRLLETLLLTAAVWILIGYVWPTLSNVEVSTLQAMGNPHLMTRDFAVQENLHFTPRFYYNLLIIAPTRAGLPLWGSFVLWHVIALAGILSGLRSAALSLGLGPAASAVLTLWIMTVGAGTLGLVSFYTYAPTPAVWALAGVTWGAALALDRRWAAAYAWFGAAALLQFLVGFYAGLLFLPMLIASRGSRALAPLAGWAVGMALVYLPMQLAGATNSGELSSALFIDLYARLRLPHHLVPSTWGWPAWVQAGGFYLGASLYLARTSRRRSPGELRYALATVALVAVALALNVLFVEIAPSALVAKLQPGRITPLAQAILLGLLATRIQGKLDRGEGVQAVILALMVLSPMPGFLLVAAALLEPRDDTAPSALAPAVLAIAVVLAYQPFSGPLVARSLHYGLWLSLAAACWVASRLTRRPPALGAVAAARASVNRGWSPGFPFHFSLNAGPADPAGILGSRFRTTSSPDALVLVPPTGETWTFKLYAERSVVVDDKNTPFSDRGLLEWKRRMDDVLGAPVTPGMDGARAWQSRSAHTLVAIARRYGAGYILSMDAWHPSFPGRRIDQEQGWSLWALDPQRPSVR